MLRGTNGKGPLGLCDDEDDRDSKKKSLARVSNLSVVALVLMSLVLWSYVVFSPLMVSFNSSASSSPMANSANHVQVQSDLASVELLGLVRDVSSKLDFLSQQTIDEATRLSDLDKRLNTMESLLATLSKSKSKLPAPSDKSSAAQTQPKKTAKTGNTVWSVTERDPTVWPVVKASSEPNQLLPPAQCQGTIVNLGGKINGVRFASRHEEISSNDDIITLVHKPSVFVATHGSGDTVSRALKADRAWEVAITEMVVGLSRYYKRNGQKMTFLDIGSNLGLFGLIAASDGHRVAFFEPVTQNLNHICESIALNHFEENTIVVPAALSSSEGVLYMTVDETNYGTTRLIEDKPQPNVEYVEVQTATLDSVIPSIDNDNGILIAKIDVEGAEYYVWQGGLKTFSERNVPVIFLENTWIFSPFEEVRFQWLRDIQQMGYRLYCCAGCRDVDKPGGRCVPIDLDAPRPEVKKITVEIVAIKEGSVDELLPILTSFQAFYTKD